MARSTDTTLAAEEKNRVNPPSKAEAIAEPGDWLSLVLEHHAQIRSAFAFARQALPGGARVSALKGLGVILNGHSLAEEVVLYPAFAKVRPKNSAQAYDEQADVKVAMADLELTDPASQEWATKLDAICEGVLAHMAEEENVWFVELKSSAPGQAKLTARYKEEFDRYTRTGSIATNAAWDSPPQAVRAT